MICSNRLPLMVVDALRTGLHAAAPMRPANSHVKSPCATVQSTVSVTTLVNGYDWTAGIFPLSCPGELVTDWLSGNALVPR